MRVRIDSSVDLTSLDEVLANYSHHAAEGIELEYRAPAQSNAHPALLSALAATAARADTQGAGARLSDGSMLPRQASRMGLGEYFGLSDSGRPYLSDPTGRYIPVHRITTTRQVGDLVTDFVPLLHAERTTASAVSYVLWELLRNVLEHSGSGEGAFVCADLSEDGRVRLGVADAGIGVPRSIRRSHVARTDRDALELAFQPGVSGTTSRFGGNETNGGAGLFFLRSMCAVGGQPLVLASGGGVSRMEGRIDAPNDLSTALDTAISSWVDLPVPVSGTIVGVDLRLDDAGEYDQMFEEIRGIYRARLSGSQRRFRRAIFT